MTVVITLLVAMLLGFPLKSAVITFFCVLIIVGLLVSLGHLADR